MIYRYDGFDRQTGWTDAVGNRMRGITIRRQYHKEQRFGLIGGPSRPTIPAPVTPVEPAREPAGRIEPHLSSGQLTIYLHWSGDSGYQYLPKALSRRAWKGLDATIYDRNSAKCRKFRMTWILPRAVRWRDVWRLSTDLRAMPSLQYDGTITLFV